jgi:hypothetical protein
VAAVSFLMLGTYVIGQTQSLPDIPLEPTMNDCQALLRLYSDAGRQASTQVSACMMSEPQIGWGQEVSVKRPCFLVKAMRAWPHCLPYEVRACELNQKRDNGYRTCYDRARARETREQAARRQAEEQIGAANRLYEGYNRAKSTYDKARAFLTNPKEFLFKQLQITARDYALRMFDSGGILRRDYIQTGNEIYKYSMNFAKEGVRATGTGIPQAIQIAALDQLGSLYGRTWKELDQALLEMKNFGTDAARPEIAPRLAVPPLHRDSPDCAVLNDVEASRRLMQRDEAAWLDLVGRCR